MSRRNGGAATIEAPTNKLELNAEMLTALMGQAAASRTLLAPDDDISYHDGSAILVPNGMDIEHLIRVAEKKRDELNEVHEFVRVFKYRPDDGAHAAAIVLRRMFGLTIGKEMKLPFGMKRPPGFRSIAIGPNRTVEVPWGLLEIPALPGAEINITSTEDDHGPVFAVVVESPKKHKPSIEALFEGIEDELRLSSIYRGKALMGARELSFMELAHFNPNQIVFADDVQVQLSSGVYSLLRHTDATRAAGLSTKRAVLAYGPYGTGKSSLGLITAQIATENGWTFLSAKAGKDKLMPVFKTAELYQPAVVFIEDIDAYTPAAKDKDAISELLDLFDGIGTKNSKLLVVMTSNHIEAVPAGMLRPGRLDYCVEVAGLDRNGCERLIQAVVPTDLLDTFIDFDAVYAEMENFQPAWVRAVATRATSIALDRSGGSLAFQLTTDDLIRAARSLHPQLDLMRKASEGEPEPELVTALGSVISSAARKGVHEGRIVYNDGDVLGHLDTTEK